MEKLRKIILKIMCVKHDLSYITGTQKKCNVQCNIIGDFFDKKGGNAQNISYTDLSS